MRRSILPFTFACLATAQVSVLTYHNDLARTGQNPNETALTPATVSSQAFGRRFAHSVDGQVYAQPLYVPAARISGKGLHNTVYVATEHDSVYAFDADSIDGANGQPLWRVSFLTTGATTAAAQDLGCGQIAPEIGITGTPVIDPSTGTLYAVAMTVENGVYAQRLHALDITSGAERPNSPVEIQATVAGTGEGSQTVVFNPRNYKARPGLLLLNGVVYTSWSSHCDAGTYHGWIMAYDAVTLKQVSVYNDTPNGNEGSFWQAGAAPAADSAGSIYVISANGDFDANTGGPNLGESYIRLTAAGGLAAADYFTPYNVVPLDGADLDTGSSGPLLLPDAAGSAAHPHLLISAGKEGRIYLVDRDNMGHFEASADSEIPQSLKGAIGGLYGIPAYFNNTVYFSGSGDFLKAFSISNAQLSTTPVSQTPTAFGSPGSTPVISSNGAADGIVWAVESGNGGTLHAYDATNVSKELFNSSRNAGNVLGSYVKFSSATVANGKVYVGTANSLVVYGLAQSEAARSLAVANAATFTVTTQAPGSIVSLFDAFGVAEAAASLPLPAVLSSAAVRVGGMLAPLLYAGPDQINAVIPYEAPLGPNRIVASVAGTDWASGTVNIQSSAPALFLIDSGRAAVLNQDSTINSPENPAPVGSFVSAFLTGLGTVQPAVPTGIAAPASPQSLLTGSASATVGGQSALIKYSGLAPGFAGLYQVNLVVPQVASGDQNLTISVAPYPSNSAPISIR